jgi:hypothetical protein
MIPINVQARLRFTCEAGFIKDDSSFGVVKEESWNFFSRSKRFVLRLDRSKLFSSEVIAQ